MKLREVLVGALVAALLAGSSFEAHSASAAKPAAGRVKYWVVLSSDRDGTNRAYSMRPDGSRLTPLLPRSRSHVPEAMSADGRVVAYSDGYVSRANGTGMHVVAKACCSVALSRNGRMLAVVAQDGIWVVRTNGRGRRRVTSGFYNFYPDFSPDAKTIVYSSFVGDDLHVFVQPLNGRRRDLGLGEHPDWSPDGRWIAYTGPHGVYVVRPTGAQRRLVTRRGFGYSWSPDGRELAFTGGYLGIARIRGGVRKVNTDGMQPGFPIWAPDGRRLFVTMIGQLWTVGRDGKGLRRLTGAGGNMAVGWTRLAPVLPPAKPLPKAERIVNGRTIATSTPVSDLSADGTRAAFITESPTDCDHPAVWTPATRGITRFGLPHLCSADSTGNGIYDLELAGPRVAWVYYGGGNTWDFTLWSATLAAPRPVGLSSNSADAGEYWPYHVHGDSEVLVFNDNARLVRVGGGREQCQERSRGSRICTTIRRKADPAPVESVSGRLIAIREAHEVSVIDIQGNVVRVFPFTASSARLDGDHLVVARGQVLERYGVQAGTLEGAQPISAGYTLADADGGIAVLRRAGAIRLVRFEDGRSLTIERRGPMRADLEGPGLYYSYAVGKTGRVVFLPRSELVRRLG
jgi:hypothetical protein